MLEKIAIVVCLFSEFVELSIEFGLIVDIDVAAVTEEKFGSWHQLSEYTNIVQL